MQVILLAGGKGTRLWPLSTEKRPKQFCKIFSNKTLLEETFERVKPLGKVSVLAPRNYLQMAKRLLGSTANYIEEPEARGTSHAVFLAASSFSPEDNLIFFPCDHYMEPADPLFDAIAQAKPFVEQGKIAVFGIKPKSPETRFGYIEMGTENAIIRFYEKPSLEKAKELLRNPNIYWNSGIFFFKSATLQDEWKKLNPTSPIFEQAIMEKTTQGVIFPLDLHWDDIGTWPSLANLIALRAKG